MSDLTKDSLKPLLDVVRKDCDLIMEIRENYINIYYKGHNLLRLKQTRDSYKVGMTNRFRVPQLDGITDLKSKNDSEKFVESIPAIKQRIITHVPDRVYPMSELESEQLLIRFNNNENLSTEYFIIDRQITKPTSKCRFDLAGIYWSRKSRRKGQAVPLVLFELKFGQNKEISQLAEQLKRYNESLEDDYIESVQTAQHLLEQKVELGLFANQSKERLEALGTLKISQDINDVRYAIVLVDDDPKSKLFTKAHPGLAKLDFQDRIDIFHVGFGLWHDRRADKEEKLAKCN